MKQKLLLVLGCMLMVMGVRAEEVTKSVTFSEYTAGSQYAPSEKHDLGGGLVIYTTKCYFTSELRIYSSSTNNGFVISDPLPGAIVSMGFNAGYSADVLNVYGSTDGKEWTLVKGVEVASKYADYTVKFSKESAYKCFKLDVEGENQIRLKTLTITYNDESIKAPTLTPSCYFDEESMEVVVTDNNTDGAEIYYTTDGETTPTTGSYRYTNPFTITETTTIKAIAIKDGNSSEVAEATYTKVNEEALADVSFSINGNVSIKTISKGGELLETSLPEVILPEGINLKGWSKDKNSTNVETFPITNITDDITLYAVFVRPASFRLVTDVAELTAGDRVIIACPKYNKAISTDEMIINDNACAVSTLVTIEDNIIIPTEVTRVFTLGKNGEYFTFEENGAYLACPEDDNRLTMRDSKDSWTITINEEGVAVINNKEYTKRSIQYYSQTPRFACYESVQKSIAIYKEATSEVVSTTYTPITISSIGYATMYLADAVAMPAGVEAYIATGVNGDYLQMEQVMGTLPAETGVILKAAEGEYAFIHSTEEAADVSRNLLKGTLTNEYIDGAGYVLSAPEGVVGLYAAKLTDGKFLNNANKAYLPASAVASNAPMFSFSRGGDEEDTTGIEYSSPLNSMPSTAIYDLTGRRVEKMEKGIYIVNGKKVIR